jgi:hypothetical protein
MPRYPGQAVYVKTKLAPRNGATGTANLGPESLAIRRGPPSRSAWMAFIVSSVAWRTRPMSAIVWAAEKPWRMAATAHSRSTCSPRVTRTVLNSLLTRQVWLGMMLTTSPTSGFFADSLTSRCPCSSDKAEGRAYGYSTTWP